jgi:release factor glutamine methyltransferase
MSLLRLVVGARERFVRAGIPPDQAAIDAEVLARHVTGWDRATYLSRRLDPVPPEAAVSLERAVARRERREPVAYITGHREFWGLEFQVTPAVLIPRPETEFIVEAALHRLADQARAWRIADVGTGSGCLAISLAAERKRAVVVATDVAADALAVARDNAIRLGVAGRIAFVETSLLNGVAGPIDLVVANPPYVPSRARTTLAPDVRDHEPEVALYGTGADGLDTVRALLHQVPARLAPDGLLMMEFGFGQADAVRAAVDEVPGLTLLEILRDLQGHERTVVARAT